MNYQENPAFLLRSLSGAGKPLHVLFAMLFIQKPQVSEVDIADFVGCTRKTARAGLRSLAQVGLVTRTHTQGGWILTQGGRQLLLTSEQLKPLEHPHITQEIPQLASDRRGKSYPSDAEKGKSYPFGHDVDDVEVKLNILNTSTTTSSEPETGKSYPFELEEVHDQALKICRAAAWVLGESLWPDVAEKITQNRQRQAYGNEHLPGLVDLVGWIAYAVDQEQVHSKAALVAANIRHERKAPDEYRHQPMDYLPERFFERAGLGDHFLEVELDFDPGPAPDEENGG